LVKVSCRAKKAAMDLEEKRENQEMRGHWVGKGLLGGPVYLASMDKKERQVLKELLDNR